MNVAEYPELIKQWHPFKNGDLKPENFTAGSHKKIWWKCPLADDHEWEARISERIRGNGCPCCSCHKVVNSNSLFSTHPKLAAEWHPVKNGSLLPNDVTAHLKIKVWWKCPLANDHEWQTTINSRTMGSGCPCCHGRKAVHSNSIATTHPQLAMEWHLTENGDLTPSNVIAGSGKKIWWQCLKNKEHIWKVSPNARVNMNTGCPVCSESKGENAVSGVLVKNNIIFKRQCKFSSCKNKRPLAFDFVFKSKNSDAKFKIIEYQGRQHYEQMGFGTNKEKAKLVFIDLQKRDEIKRKWCRKKGIPLLEIPYWNFKKIEKLVEEFINE